MSDEAAIGAVVDEMYAMISGPAGPRDWLRQVMSGVMHLTLVEPRADYVPGQKIGWNPAAARPAGKASGTGAWSSAGILAGTTIFEVHDSYRPYGGSNEGILTVRFLRSNN